MRCPRTRYNVWCCRAQTYHGWEASKKWGPCFTCCCHLPSTGLLRRWQFPFLLMSQPLLCALETQLAPKLFISTAFNKRYSYHLIMHEPLLFLLFLLSSSGSVGELKGWDFRGLGIMQLKIFNITLKFSRVVLLKC